MAQPAKHIFRLSLLLASAAVIASCGSSATTPAGGVNGSNPGSTLPPPAPGQTDFTTEEATSSSKGAPGRGEATGSAGGTNAGAAPSPTAPASDNAAPPAGRVADVEEADIYKVDHNRLFYLNTYRGFIAYDVNDPKNPQRLGRLPVFGYPIEMFVSGNTVYALLKDSLYLTQVNGQFQFQRHDVSQLVTIDITDLANPKVLKTIDIVGELREGVSRKIQDTIYVVSYIPRTYFWGWLPDPDAQKEQAWVYSFNVANPQDPQKVGEYKIFEGGSVTTSDSAGNYYDKSFQSVYISATSNALMVAENWSVSASVAGKPTGTASYGCGSYAYNQYARVSLIDISNPSGAIPAQPQAVFESGGTIGDQFKMTYDNDPVAKTGTFYGIFARQVWEGSNCTGNSYTQNTFESWDVSVPGKPVKLAALDIGNQNETVRGSTFDTDRKVAYAITAQRVDPLYAISFADRTKPAVVSTIDGLAGDISVFRLVNGNKFLLAVGQDASVSCTGFQDTTQGWQPSKIAVSLIDVQDLSKARLVQRQCVAVKNADWIGSDISNNLDQAHKMLGMESDGTVNVITVPVYYSKKVDSPDNYGWYRYETAVGLMTWDLTKYDPTKSELEQTVIQNYGTFVHPHGEVRRSIVFTHEGAVQTRMMINLSDTHITIANIQDMANPTLESEIEVAPYYDQIYRFGDFLVEQVESKPQAWVGPAQQAATFRVKRAGGELDGVAPLASIDVGGVYRVLKANESLVLFRQSLQKDPMTGVPLPPQSDAVVLDLRDPTHPRLAGHVDLPAFGDYPYYLYWCGIDSYWGGFWFDNASTFAATDRGFAFYVSTWKYENNQASSTNSLVFLDVSNPDAPTVSQADLPTTFEWGSFGVVADPIDPSGFYVSYRKNLGDVKTTDDMVYTRYKYYAQRWQRQGDSWAATQDINTPGRLIRTWQSGTGERMFLAQDNRYRIVDNGMNRNWVYDNRLSLLHQVDLGGKPAAALLDTKVFTDLYLSSLMMMGDRLVLAARPQVNYWGAYGGVGVAVPAPALRALTAAPTWEMTSDRLMIFDLAQKTLAATYDQPTRMYNVQLMGTHAGKLFLNLAGNGYFYAYDGVSYGGGDGILEVDLGQPAAPVGQRFIRTLGVATHLEFFDGDAYVASGYFGLTHFGLDDAPQITAETGL